VCKKLRLRPKQMQRRFKSLEASQVRVSSWQKGVARNQRQDMLRLRATSMSINKTFKLQHTHEGPGLLA